MSRQDRKCGKDDIKNFDVAAHPESKYSHQDLNAIERIIRGRASDLHFLCDELGCDVPEFLNSMSPKDIPRRVLTHGYIHSLNDAIIKLHNLETHLIAASANSKDLNKLQRVKNLHKLSSDTRGLFQRLHNLIDTATQDEIKKQTLERQSGAAAKEDRINKQTLQSHQDPATGSAPAASTRPDLQDNKTIYEAEIRRQALGHQSGAAAPAASAGPTPQAIASDNQAISMAAVQRAAQDFISHLKQTNFSILIHGEIPTKLVREFLENKLTTTARVMIFNQLNNPNDMSDFLYTLSNFLFGMHRREETPDDKKLLIILAEIFNNRDPELLPQIKTRMIRWVNEGPHGRVNSAKMKLAIINPSINAEDLTRLLAGYQSSTPLRLIGKGKPGPELAAIRQLTVNKNPADPISFQEISKAISDVQQEVGADQFRIHLLSEPESPGDITGVSNVIRAIGRVLAEKAEQAISNLTEKQPIQNK